MVKIAVIGCGYWGPNLIRNFSSMAECEQVIACDFDEKKLARIKGLNPQVRTTTDANAMFEDASIDAIAVATPVRFHYDLAMRALQSGKHTFVEKPLASTSQECRELIAVAEQKQLKLMVGHTFEYAAPVHKMREIIQSGDLGEVLCIRSQRLNLGLFQTDINVIWDLAPHDLSILLYLLDSEPNVVHGTGQAHFFKDIEDVAQATLHFNSGAIAFLQTSWLDPNKVRQMTIVGSKKMLVYDDILPNEKVKIFDKGINAPRPYDSFGEFQFSYRYGDIFCPYIAEHEPLKLECGHFIESILNDTTPQTDGYNGLRVVRLLEAICESIQKRGKAVVVGKEGTMEFATMESFARN